MIRLAPRTRSALLLALVGGLLATLATVRPTAEARTEDAAKPVLERNLADGHVRVTVPAVAPVAPGDTFSLVVEAKIDRGWKIYGSKLGEDLGIATALSVADPAPFVAVGTLEESKPKERYDAIMEGTMLEHEKEARFALKFSVPEGTSGGAYTVKASFTTQACDVSACLMPETIAIELPVVVEGPGGKASAGESAAPAFAQATKVVDTRSAADGHVRLEALVVPEAAAGTTVEVAVRAKIDRGWKIYGTQLPEDLGIATAFSVEASAPLTVAGDLIETEPKTRFDPIMEGTMIEHEKEARFSVAIAIPAGVPPGEYSVDGIFTTQACDANACLLPETFTFAFPIVVASASAAGAPTGNASSTDSGNGAAPAAGADVDAKFVQEQILEPDHPVRWTLEGAAGVEPGETFEIVATATIERGWHIYTIQPHPDDLWYATKVEVVEPGPFLPAGDLKEPTPKVHEIWGDTYLEHEGKPAFRLPLKAPEDLATPGKYTVGVAVSYMPCDVNGCLQDTTLRFDLPVWVGIDRDAGSTDGTSTGAGGAGGVESVDGARGNGGTAGTLPPISFTAKLDRSQVKEGETVTLTFEGTVNAENVRIPAIERDLVSEQGIWGIILLSISGALIALLTPCVYPMIPITISVFTKQAHQKRSAVVGLALLFGIGVMASFTSLGLLLSAILGENGANFMATNPVVNFLIGALFVYFAFSLFGYYDIQLPAFLRNRVAGGGAGGGGVASVLIMGFVFSVTTFTCVGPIAAALLALAAGQGPGVAAIGMLAFSGTFALPFVLLALFPKAMSGLPKSGGWLGTVKGILGFIELIAAWKFFSATIGRLGWDAVISREVIFAIWGLTMVAMALYILGKIKFPHDSPLQKIGAGRVVLVMLILAGAGFCFAAVAGHRLNENLESQLLVKSFHAKGEHLEYRILSKDHPDVTWEGELKKIRDAIKAGGERKPIFINFTGHV